MMQITSNSNTWYSSAAGISSSGALPQETDETNASAVLIFGASKSVLAT